MISNPIQWWRFHPDAQGGYPVPFILIDPTQKWVLKAETGSLSGGIAQIGATLLQLCGLEVPESYLPSLVRPK